MLMTLTDWLWSYVLIGALLIVGARFTVGSRGVQIRLFRSTFAVLANIDWRGSDRGISSFQALAVSIAGRVGGGGLRKRRHAAAAVADLGARDRRARVRRRRRRVGPGTAPLARTAVRAAP